MHDQRLTDQPLDLGPLRVYPIVGRIGHTRYDVPPNLAAVRFAEMEDPHVGSIRVRNGGLRPVLIPAGWLVEGLRQSRMLVDDFLVAAGAEMAIPVACVEHGRWGDTRQAQAVGRAPVRVLATAQRADDTQDADADPDPESSRQSRVWTTVRGYEERTGRRSTSSLPQILDEDLGSSGPAARLATAVDSVELPHGATGFVVSVGSEPVLVELFSRPESVTGVLRSTLRGMLLDLPGQPGKSGSEPDRRTVEAFVEAARRAPSTESGGAGAGRLLRLDSEQIHGRLLLSEAGEFLHLTAISRDFFDLAV